MAHYISSLNARVVAEAGGLKTRSETMTGRLSLRARKDLDRYHAALGAALPTRIGQVAKGDGIEIVCLGPDEWLLVLPLDRVAAVQETLAELYADLPHAVTDVSGREVTFHIEGAQAQTLLTIGCPRDIRSIAQGQARRTVFDGVSVVIWCDTPESYRMDVWNSFAPFVAQTLETGTRELAAEAAQ